jgi:putative toxin-antitoxin system antitoxin component (TIGR02293 family)
MQSEQETAKRAEMLLHVDAPPAPGVDDEGVDNERVGDQSVGDGNVGNGRVGEEPTGSAPQDLSMDEILRDVDRTLGEEGPPVAEQLTGAATHERHAAVLAGMPYQAFERVRDVLNVSVDDLAHVVGSSERTMRRRKGSGRLSTSESDALVRIAVAIERATRALGDERGVRWLTTPHPLLHGERALDLLSTSAGASVVGDMLGGIEHGMPV